MKDLIKYFVALLLIPVCGNRMLAQEAGIRQNIGTGDPTPSYACLIVKEDDSFSGYWTSIKADSTENVHMLLSFHDGDDVGDKVNLKIFRIERPDTLDENAVFNVIIDAGGTLKKDSAWTYVEIDTAAIRCDFHYINYGSNDDNRKLMKIGQQLCSRVKSDVTKKFGSLLRIKKVKYRALSLDGITFEKEYSNISIKYVEIEGRKGYLAKSGLSGKYIILQWGDWNYKEDYVNINKYPVKKARSITLLPFDTDEEDNYMFGEPIVMKCPKGNLGLTIHDIRKPYPFFFTNILPRYLMVE